MDREIFFRITATVFIILTLITIIFALIIIIIIIYKWKSLSRSTTDLLLCNSCATLLYHSIATIIQIPFLFTTHTTTTTTVCKIYAYTYFCSCTTIAYSYLIQAISRYFITILYKHKTLLTFRTSWILVFLNWLVSGILAAFMFISPVVYQYESESRLCLLTSKVFIPSFIGIIFAFCIPLTVVILLYILILHHTTRNRIHSNTFTVLRLKRNLKVFRTILVFTFIFAIGGTPYFISVLINHVNRIPWPLYLLSILFISLSCALESLALFFTNTQVKTLFYAMIHKQQQEDAHSIMRHNDRLIPQTNQINNIQLIRIID